MAEEADPDAPDLRTSVRKAIDAMDWLTDADEGHVALALRLAQEIETARDRAKQLDALRAMPEAAEFWKMLDRLDAHCNATKVTGWLGVQLQGVMRDLGGTPAARAAMSQGDKPVKGRLAQLRDAAGRE